MYSGLPLRSHVIREAPQIPVHRYLDRNHHKFSLIDFAVIYVITQTLFVSIVPYYIN